MLSCYYICCLLFLNKNKMLRVAVLIAPVIFLLGSFFPSAFYAEIQGASAPEQLVLSQDPAVGFSWIADPLTNSRLMLGEKYKLHCCLSPVTDIWRGFGWNFVLKYKNPCLEAYTHCVDIPGKALLTLRCVLTNRNISWKQILVSTIFLRNRGTSGSHGIVFLRVSHSVLHKELTSVPILCRPLTTGLF